MWCFVVGKMVGLYNVFKGRIGRCCVQAVCEFFFVVGWGVSDRIEMRMWACHEVIRIVVCN